MPSILFVCTANVCRSPMASAIFQQLLSERITEGEWRIESAGVWGMDGSPVALGSLEALSKMNIDLSGHYAQSVSEDLLDEFDLILTMERGHKEALQWQFPEIRGQVYMLSEMVGKIFDIRDPIGGSTADFEETARELAKMINDGFEQIVKQANKLR